ncbi:MAG: hypothetical protein DDT20_00861 [Firmicutes bacterium]|nr:hypothetical protein [Bacillota bacterium]
MISKPERFEQEKTIFAQRMEPGLQALRAWAYDRLGEINLRWPHARGEDLTELQGSAQFVLKLIRLLDQGPSVKGEA